MFCVETVSMSAGPDWLDRPWRRQLQRCISTVVRWADMPGFGIKGWDKGDGRAGRARKLATWERAMAIHSLK